MFLEVRSMRNFGCALNSLLKRNRQIINRPEFQNREGCLFLLDTVLNFIAVSFAQLLIALLNIPVLSAKRERTALVSVIFVPQRVNQTPILTVQPSLPTPVKLKPLAKFLPGYPPDLVQYNFWLFQRFSVTFSRPLTIFFPWPYKIQNLSTRNWDKSWLQTASHACPFTLPLFQSLETLRSTTRPVRQRVSNFSSKMSPKLFNAVTV